MGENINRRQLVRGSIAAGVAAGLVGRDARASQSTPEASGGGDARVIAAANGDIEIAGTPERVIVMEYELVEDAVILGVEPVGVCERDSINRWVPLPEPLPESVTEVGTRDEPDLEVILGLQPDLIIAAKPRQDEVLDNRQSIATTVQLETYSPFFTPADDISPIQHAQRVLMQVAESTNRVKEGETAIAEFDALLEQAAAAFGASEFAGRSFAYISSIVDGMTAQIMNDRSRIGYTISQLGLANLAGENEETPGLHYQEISVENLGRHIPEDALVFFAHSTETADEMKEYFAGSVWQAMPFVQAGNFNDMGEPNVWTAGSMITLTNLIERVAGALGVDITA